MIEGQEGLEWPDWLALARACERHGVPALFRSDHYLNVDGRLEQGSLDAWGTICALAAVTTRLRLGTLVSPIMFRHPASLAKLVTTADHVSGGRVELGIGAGWHKGEHRAYGFDFPAAGDRTAILEEQLEILVGMWSDDPFSFVGENYQLQRLDARPKPVQRPHPRLILGGNAGPRGARLAARFADEYNTPEPALAEVVARRAALATACEEVGRPEIPLSVMTGVVVGVDEADLHLRLQRVAKIAGSDPRVLRLQPPKGWIVGRVDEAAAQLIALRDVGVSRVMCQQPAYDDLTAVALLGEELAPRVAVRPVGPPRGEGGATGWA